MIDVHCHLNFHAYENNYDEVINSAFEKGVTHIINVGTKIDSSEKAIALAEKYDHLFAIVGIHPHHADRLFQGETLHKVSPSQHDTWLIQLEHLAKHPKALAIGEVGMDYFSYHSNGIVDPKLQEYVFRKQIELSIQCHLPLQIHNRQAGEDVIRILNDYKNEFQNPPGMFHCFAGTNEVLHRALQLGFYIGFDGNITYKGIAKGETVALKDLATKTPMDRILTETDSPFLTPVPHRGGQNKPEYVIHVGEFLAEVKNVTFEEIKRKTTQNAFTLFPALSGTIK